MEEVILHPVFSVGQVVERLDDIPLASQIGRAAEMLVSHALLHLGRAQTSLALRPTSAKVAVVKIGVNNMCILSGHGLKCHKLRSIIIIPVLH